MAAVPRSTPVIVGVGEVRNKDADSSRAIEPADLMLEAIRRAVTDASIPETEFLSADSISVVPPWTWAYPDLPGLIAQKLKIRPSHLVISNHGGNQPARLCDDAARRISAGESKLAIITGGEALASCKPRSSIIVEISALTVSSGCLPEEWANATAWMDQTRPEPEIRLSQRPLFDGTE